MGDEVPNAPEKSQPTSPSPEVPELVAPQPPPPLQPPPQAVPAPTQQPSEEWMSGFEKSTLRWAKTAVFMSGLAAVFVCLQWIVMRQTLNEMKQSGETATNQLWQAIGNMNWTARTANESLQQTQKAVEVSESQSNKALNTSIAIAHNEQRAWIVVPFKYGLVDLVANGPITYSMGFVNVGKTPAESVDALVRAQVLAIGNDPSFTFEHGTSNEFQLGELVPNEEQPPQQLQARSKNMPLILSAEQLEMIKSGLAYEATYGQVKYSDKAGSHWMRFCKSTNTVPIEKDKAPTKCGQYNSSGDGRPPQATPKPH